jgi:hypothetical protein
MKLYERIIPKNSSTSYISGWEALNISDENRNTADWHPRTYLFSYDKDKAINLYNTTNVLGNSGIKKRIIDYPSQREVYIANFPRAIADLVLTMKDYQLSSLHNCCNDFLNEDETEHLYQYLIKNNPRVDEFLKYEFTVRYFNDKKL